MNGGVEIGRVTDERLRGDGWPGAPRPRGRVGGPYGRCPGPEGNEARA